MILESRTWLAPFLDFPFVIQIQNKKTAQDALGFIGRMATKQNEVCFSMSAHCV